MLSKADKRAIVLALPELKAMKETLTGLNARPGASLDYLRLINTLYCQVFAVMVQFETKLSENACNEAMQLPLIETVHPGAPGMIPVYKYPDLFGETSRFESR